MLKIESSNIMFVNASKELKSGDFGYRIYTFVDMDNFNKFTFIGDASIELPQPKTMVEITASLSQKEVTVNNSPRTENKIFIQQITVLNQKG